MRKLNLLAAGLLSLLVLAGCEKPGAWGDVNALIVVSSPEAWQALQGPIEDALEPTIFTVRDEHTFRVTHVDPTTGEWGNMRRFVQLVAVGSMDDPWVAEALEARRGDEPVSPPEMVVAYDVWARGQQVTVLVVEPGRWDQAEPLLLPLHEMLDEQFRQWARNRMFMTGADTTLQRVLEEEAGFSLLLPEVYDWGAVDSVYRFRNDNPDPSELIREVVVTWRSPVPDAPVTGEEMLAWRTENVEMYYNFPQVVSSEGAIASPGTLGGNQAYQIQAIWENPPGEFPAAGPFILRAVTCPDQDRLYLLDAWLYAPGKGKYEYMLQLETILNSFKCGD